jgi:PAS domain S-box-containing protein
VERYLTLLYNASIRARLLLLIMLTTIPILAFTAISAIQEHNAAAEQIQEKTSQLTELATANQEQWIEGARQLLVALAHLPAVRNRDAAACSEFFMEIHKQYPLYANIFAATPQGDLFCSAIPAKEKINSADLAWFKRAVSLKDFALGDYQAKGRITGIPVLVAAYPIYDAAGNLQAVVCVSLDLAWLNEQATQLRLPPDATFIVIDSNGTILSIYPDPGQWTGRSLPETDIIQTVLREQKGTGQIAGLDNILRLNAFAPVANRERNTGIYINIGIPASVVFGEIDQRFIRSLTWLCLVTALMLLIAWSGANLLILRHVNMLVNAARRLGGGELNVRTGALYHSNEIGVVARVFDEMAEALDKREAERKQAEQTLRASEARLHVTFEHANDAIHIDNADDEIIEVNSRMCELTGYSREELLTMRITDLQAPEVRMSDKVILTEMEKYGNIPFEKLNLHRDGRRIPVEVSVSRIEDPQGDLYVSILRDITERKRVETALRESEERFQQVAENASEWIWEVDQDGLYTYASPGVERILGYTPQEVVNRLHFYDLFEPESREDAKQKVFVGFAQKAAFKDFINVNRHKDGRTMILSTGCVPLLDENGDLIGYRGVDMDITERKQAESALQKSEERYRLLFNGMTEGFALHELIFGENGEPCDYRFLDINRAFENLTGLKREELIGKGQREALPAEDPFWFKTYCKVALTGESVHLEHYSPPLQRYYEVNAYCPAPNQFAVIFKDITERKQAEDALRSSELNLNKAQHYAHVGSWTWNIKTNQLKWSDEMYRIFGIDKESFTGDLADVVARAIHPDDREKVNDSNRSVSEDGKPAPLEYRVVLPDGAIRVVWGEAGEMILDESGAPSLLSGIVQDITERKQVEEALRESERTLKESQVIGKIGNWEYDFTAQKLNWSDETYLLYERDKALGTPSIEEEARYYSPEETGRLREFARLALETGKNFEYDFEARLPSGKISYFSGTLNPVKDQTGKIVKLVGTIQDITARKQAEDALRENEERWRRAIADSPIPIMIHNEDDQVLQLSAGWTRYSGYTIEDIPTLTDWTERAYGERTGPQKEYIDSLFSIDKTKNNGEWTITAKDGSKRIWAFQTTPLGRMNKDRRVLHSMAIDITERKRAEKEVDQLNASLEERVKERTAQLEEAQEQLVRHEKLAVLGQMAGSVGHELRNPLGVMSNAVYFLKMVQTDASEKVKEYLNLIEKNIRISDKIVGDLLDFTRIKSVEREPVSASQLIRQTLERFPAPDSIQVTLDLPADLQQGYADSHHVVQILGNLVINACQAMDSTNSVEAAQGVGNLTISSYAQSDMICIAVQDSGAGIPPENMKKLFEPLFTTKPKGIGLGLAVSRKLAEANGGRIEALSEVGRGSTFTLCLPVYRRNQ